MVAPLDGVRVVEVTGWMAGPGAGAALADLGAEVVKVEPLRGDPVRGVTRQAKVPEGAPRLDYAFQADNRGKRSVAVAVDRREGADLVRRLAAGADVFLCNLLPHRQDRFGLDPATLLGVQPRLVHATITGYGTTGPDATRPGFDVTAFFGRGAITDGMTEPGGVAPRALPAQGDHTTSLALVAGILAALRLVERTGAGQVVEVSLLGTAAWTVLTDLAVTLVDGREPRRRDRHHVVSALANRFRCRDDRWILLQMPEPRYWPRFCEAVGRTAWIDDPRFATPKARFDHMPELVDLLDALLGERTLEEWGRLLDDAGLIWGPVSTLSELAADPQAAAAGLYPEVAHPVGSFRTVGVPLQIRDADIGPRGPAPELGEHTADVLGELGLTRGEVAALAAAGVVGPAGLADEADDDVPPG